MKIALIGATGNVGSRILTELLNRGHEVTGIARHPEKLSPQPNLTVLSPSLQFAPGERTGKFRVGTDQLLVGENGESKISLEDYAVALVDELETPRHSRQRFTVGY